MKNIIYIATSLDGFIADKNDNLDWLPAPEGADFGFDAFMQSIDAIVMGKNTFNMVLSFGIEWPYNKPVFVVSSTLKTIPEALEGKVSLVQGNPSELVKQLNAQGYEKLYIDGGVTIQNFLKENLIDEMIITTIPILLGGGKPLFAELNERQQFKCVEPKVINGMVQNHFIKEK